MAGAAQNLNLKTGDLPKALALEDILASRGLLTREQVTFIKNEVRTRQQPSDVVLAQVGWVPEEKLVEAKAEIIGVPYVDPAQKPISPEVLAFLPEEVAKRFVVIPFARDNQT